MFRNSGAAEAVYAVVRWLSVEKGKKKVVVVECSSQREQKLCSCLLMGVDSTAEGNIQAVKSLASW